MFQSWMKPMANRMATFSNFDQTFSDEPPIDYSSEDEFEADENSKNEDDNDIDPSMRQLPVIDFGRLCLERIVGQGGFGKVYRAKFGEHCVAVKEPIYYDQSRVKHINQEIVNEAKLHYQLHHPNVIQLHGISFNGDRVFLVMEYAHGKSLRELITKRTLSPNVIIKFAIQISSAMEYLHHFKPHPIIHRDLKSQNILLNEHINEGDLSDKQLKLTDLGLAKEFTHSTKMSQCGTYSWMAPESITESKFSKSSDVWSFGVVLWELLTGQIPYRGFSAPAIAYGIGNGKLTLPIPTTCPNELKQILQACWNQDPKMRPSFTEICVELQKSSFNVINIEQFRKMKQNWFIEIDNILKSLKQKEKELESREEEARRKEKEVEMMKRILEQQTEELKRREIEVAGRELHVLLQQQEQHQEAASGGKHKRRPSHKKSIAPSTKISYPQNFCHNLTITTSQTEFSLPILQARALNQTWGPGTKIRPELFHNLFSKSRSSSNSQDLVCEKDPKSRPNDKPPKAPKKISSFFRRMFRSSKSNLNRTDRGKDSGKNVNEIGYDQEENEDYDENDDDIDDEYDQIDSVNKLREQFVLQNRTYHGQTKHSERKRLNDMYEHFVDFIIDTEKDNVPEGAFIDNDISYHKIGHISPCNELYDDVELLRNVIRAHPASSAKNRYNRQDYNNNNHKNSNFLRDDEFERPSSSINHYPSSTSRSNSTRSNTRSITTSKSTSEQGFDEDLLQEFDRFEQELQSMNCPSI